MAFLDQNIFVYWKTPEKSLQSKPEERHLLDYLRLKRIGLYPQLQDYFAVLDYALDQRLTNYLIVVKFNKQGNVTELTTES